MITDGWWTGFFSGFIVEAWRRVPQNTAAEADFIAKELALKPGDHVLDVPCGGGRLSGALAERGATTTGVDISEEFLSDAAKLPAGAWHRRDMRELTELGPFDHAFSFGNSFGYFDDVGNRAFFESVASVVKPDGRFVLETHLCAEGILPQPLGKRWYEFGDLIFLHDSHYDPALATLTSDYVLIRDGAVERRQAKYRVYTYAQLIAMLGECGWTVINTYGSLERQPFRLGSVGLWVVAAKR